MKLFAKIITYLTFPGFWAVVGVFLLSKIDIANIIIIQEKTQDKLVTASLLMHTIIPMLFVLFMVYKKRFQSIELATTKERKIAVPFAFLSACVLYYSAFEFIVSKENTTILNNVNLVHLHPLLEWCQLICITLLIQVLFTFLNFKISIHMLSITAFTTFFIGQFNTIRKFTVADCLVGENIYHWPSFMLTAQGINFMIAALLVVSVLVFIARKILNAHTYQELIIGSIVGISITFVNSNLLYILWN